AALEEVMARQSTGRIATVVGRYYAMDRDKRWERTRLAYSAVVEGRAETTATSAGAAIQASYEAGVTDEFIKPVVIVGADHRPVGPVRHDDSVVFFNFRADRARQLTRAIALDDFDGFDRPDRPRVHYVMMTVYDRTFGLPAVFTPQSFTGNFADVLAERGRTNLRPAGPGNAAPVTSSSTGGRDQPYPAEDRILVPSQKVAPYDLKPEMSAPGITDELVADLGARRHDVVICNFANADMVGHTGRLD